MNSRLVSEGDDEENVAECRERRGADEREDNENRAVKKWRGNVQQREMKANT